jgi:hypothetical protein
VTVNQNPDIMTSLDTDFCLRRMRALLFGQLNDKVQFFVETDNPNFGRGGEFSGNMFILCIPNGS